MNPATQNLSLYFVRETPAALRYCREKDEAKAGPDIPDNPNYLWLPRSVCTHRTKYAKESFSWQLHVVSVECWFLEKQGLA